MQYYIIVDFMADTNSKHKLTNGLLFRTALIFGVFTIVVLIFSCLTIYAIEMKEYKAQKVEDIKSIGDYLERMIQEAGEEFQVYQDYYMEHFAEANIPYGFNEYLTAQRRFENILAQQPPRKESDETKFGFESFSEEAKMAYFVYIHEYWLLNFENARKSFGLPYTYYLVPKEDIYHMVYMIDGERTHKDIRGEKSDSGEYLYLGDEYYDPPEKYKVQWRSWFTGERQKDFEVWNNEWGHTYAYYTPLIINGRKMGLIGTEVEVEAVNKTILFTSLKIAGGIAGGLVACIIIVLLVLNSVYIKKVVVLESQMREFALNKDPSIVQTIESGIKGKNEIASLSRQFADLILELQNYMSKLLSTSNELKDTRLLADQLNTLANKDALTGVRNKTAYDSEVRRLDEGIANGKKEFGIAMMDLNFLKKINDTYGHEYGNMAIKKLCYIICHIFAHSPVFRIGGDEFVAILERGDYAKAESLVDEFNRQLDELEKDKSLKPWEKVSAAIACAFFEPHDKCVADVFRRADLKMYKRKKEMKGLRVD